MESMNLDHNFEDGYTNLNDEALIGWSATCLDQTISYYVECQYNEINEDNDSNQTENG
uniref:Uncharacterized protein n=1 Tax=Scinaia undulata TaxID=1884664 RepID=A0A1G4NXH7_9FLOR|nr:Hypothetical protein ORF_8 [Scinaia undulata]SCW23368.1 Hypothetical protein ORF_8 [Scinaia undulata]